MARARSRQDAERHGRHAETLAALLLRLKGYRVLARHWKTPMGEIDLIARRGRILAIVEVKARSGAAAAIESLGRRQRLRIGRAALQYQATRPDLAACQVRFDMILVTPWRIPVHMPNAWIDSE
jgi:putative endonuclease